MFTPDSLRPPPLVDRDDSAYGNPPFIPPPQGVTNGGQPGPGWGPGWGFQSDYQHRVNGNGTPYPHNAQLPSNNAWASSSTAGGGGGGPPAGWANSPTAPPLNSAHSWTYGYNPTSPHSPWQAGWGQTPATSWGPQTPAGGWGAAAQPTSPYTPWGAYPSPYNQPASAPVQPPGSPYESSSGQPITGGWFGAGAGAGAASAGAALGGGGGGDGGWGGTWGGGGGATWGGGGGAWQNETWGQERGRQRRSDHRHGHGREHESDGEDIGAYHRLGRSNTIKRSHSNAAAHRRGKSLQRSASWGNVDANANGGGFGGWSPGEWGSTPQYAQHDTFDEHNLARRPRDWRPDYSVKGGLGAYIPNIVYKNRSSVKGTRSSCIYPHCSHVYTEWNDPVRRHLHPLLTYDPSNPPIYYDLRITTFDPRDVEFLNLPGHRLANHIDFAQLAVQPTCAFMRLSHPRFPWYIDITQSHPNGVTVFDILSQMHAQLHTSIHPRHFWNEELGEQERAALTKTFQERVKGAPELVQRGVLQVDFLGEKCVFEGLVRGQKGVWELKLGREQP
ncbi:hypothetical protein CPB84DRAFT_1733144 [Gymnopilus junonius]|uniref:DUF6699 domain-containing protein n=1 Tax=Gymnopilus junonius TaxID=109634 RepID=A0A9P5NIN8_GYMJU|nr:hypothetical protein CPB84DRAFT_1733144 [Gymnopilus junonius]